MKDLRGQVFSRLLVLALSHRGKNYKSYWLCVCDCNNKTIVRSDQLCDGHTRSCGCLQRESLLLRPPRLSHGHMVEHKPSRTYSSWWNMKNRCYREDSNGYENYGGRGISICNRWINSFTNFLEDMGERPTGRTLDRRDVNGNYEPNNCRWATPKEQANNKRIHSTRDVVSCC